MTLQPYQRRDRIRAENSSLPPAFRAATCSVDVSVGSVVAAAKLVGKASVDTCKITLSIQRKAASKWTSIKSRTVTKGAQTANVTGQLAVASGNTYRATADMVITVSGESTSVTKTSNAITA